MSILVRQAILSQAVAEAAGRTFEFKRNIKPKDVRSLIWSGDTLNITDDTQMTLFGMEAMREYWIDRAGMLTELEIHTKHLIEWYNTQDARDAKKNNTWLGCNVQMHNTVAPGGTCLNSLDALSYGIEVKNGSNGCGTVMKALPFALNLLCSDVGLERAVRLAYNVSALTHKSTQVYAAIEKYVGVAYKLMSTGESSILSQVAEKGSHISDHGDGWNATECLDMALWAVGNSECYEELLINSIAHDGDSDSVAAVAGALWALAGLPVEQDPMFIYMLPRLKERSVVEKVAERFCFGLTQA